MTIKSFYSSEEKDLMYQANLKRFEEVFQKLGAEKYSILKNLIESVAFMNVELKNLEQVIRRDGTVEEYRNGACQRGYKKSSSVEVYNAMLKNYTTCIKQLIEALKVEDKDGLEDDFDRFCSIRSS